MSAPLAGKFQDHYVFLGIDPGADTETIQIAYAKMIEKYGPEGDNDPEKLEMINSAYETLSDPQLRKEFDKIKGVSSDRGRLLFTGLEFFDILGQQVGLRGAILSVLYDRRRTKPFTPALSMRQLESMLETEVEAMNFALWYLKQRGFIAPDDKSSLQITAAGMDFLETKRPDPEEVMPFIKLAAIAGMQAPAPVSAPPVSAIARPENAEPENPVPENAGLEDTELAPEVEVEPVLSVAQPISQAPAQTTVRPIGKLDGNAIRGMATRGTFRR